MLNKGCSFPCFLHHSNIFLEYFRTEDLEDLEELDVLDVLDLLVFDSFCVKANLSEVGSAFIKTFSKKDLVEGGTCKVLITGQSSRDGTLGGGGWRIGGLLLITLEKVEERGCIVQ